MKTISFRNDILPLKDKLYRLALRITLNTQEAEDVVQDTLMKLWQQQDAWQQIRSLEAYCMTVCRRQALDKAALAANHNLTLDGQPEQMAPQHTPDQALSLNERMALVRRLMDSLPEVQRSIVQLRDVEGYPYKEIADVLQLSETQVKVYLHRARKFIRNEIEKLDEYGL